MIILNPNKDETPKVTFKTLDNSHMKVKIVIKGIIGNQDVGELHDILKSPFIRIEEEEGEDE